MRIDVKGTIVSNNDAPVYNWYKIENTCPGDVQKAIDSAGGAPVDVYIDSGGGDIFAGSDIYSTLREYRGTVKIHVTGLAASAASVIACAGESEISPTAMVMVHNVSTVAAGDYRDMDKTCETLKECNKAIAAAYCEKTGMSEAEALTLMDNETWLPAKKAVEIGLIDKISEQSNVRIAASVTNLLPPEVVEKTKNMIENPTGNKSDFFMQKTQAKLKLLKMKGGI